eukprot:6621020-Prymnesium_polylepis.1
MPRGPRAHSPRLNVAPVRSTNSHGTTASLAAIGGRHLRRFGGGSAPSAAAAAPASAGRSRAFESSQTILLSGWQASRNARYTSSTSIVGRNGHWSSSLCNRSSVLKRL